tara:strand:- start:159 stop:359 length:201 start_codon:yes stop_codon:yes gene_type:complete
MKTLLVRIKEIRYGYLEFENQENYDTWKENGELLDSAIQESRSTTLEHPDGTQSSDYSENPEVWEP